VLAGFLLSAIPLACCAAILLATPVIPCGANQLVRGCKSGRRGRGVPLIEETFFRGLFWARFENWAPLDVDLATSALYYRPFLKAPEHTSSTRNLDVGIQFQSRTRLSNSPIRSGCRGLYHLFLIGLILADAGLQTHSRFDRFARRLDTHCAHSTRLRSPVDRPAVLGKNLLVGVVPLRRSPA